MHSLRCGDSPSFRICFLLGLPVRLLLRFDGPVSCHRTVRDGKVLSRQRQRVHGLCGGPSAGKRGLDILRRVRGRHFPDFDRLPRVCALLRRYFSAFQRLHVLLRLRRGTIPTEFWSIHLHKLRWRAVSTRFRSIVLPRLRVGYLLCLWFVCPVCVPARIFCNRKCIELFKLPSWPEPAFFLPSNLRVLCLGQLPSNQRRHGLR